MYNNDKLIAAVEFLMDHVAGTEKPSKEVLRMAQEAGIVKRTLGRAKIIVGARSRKSGNGGWFMSIPADQLECVDEAVKQLKRPKHSERGKISSDWVIVITDARLGG